MAALKSALVLLGMLSIHVVRGDDQTTEVRTFVAKIRDRIECENHEVERERCLECMDPEAILSLLKPASTSSVFQDVSMFLSHQILYFESMCVSRGKGCGDIDECQEDVLKVMARYSSPKEALLNILKMFKMHIKEEAGGKECFSAGDVLKELPSNSYGNSQIQTTREMFAIVMRKISEGLCIEIGESVTDFVDDIFHHYGDKCSPYMTLNGLKQVIHDLKSGSGKEHDHDHNHAHHHDRDHEHSHDECDHGHGHSAHSHSHDHDHGDGHSTHSHDHDHGALHSNIRYIRPNHDHSHDHPHNHNHSHDHPHTHDHGHSHDHDHSHDHPHNHDTDHSHDHPHSDHDHNHTHDYDYSKINESYIHDNQTNNESFSDDATQNNSKSNNGIISNIENHDHSHDHSNHDHSHGHNHDHDHDHDHDHSHTNNVSFSDYSRQNGSISNNDSISNIHNHDHSHDHPDHNHDHNHDYSKQNGSLSNIHNHDHSHDHPDHNHNHEHDHDHDYSKQNGSISNIPNHDHSHDHPDHNHNHDHNHEHDHDHSHSHSHSRASKSTQRPASVASTESETTTVSFAPETDFDSTTPPETTTLTTLESFEMTTDIPQEAPSNIRKKRMTDDVDEDFKGPFASLRSHLSHQEDQPEEEGVEQTPPDDVKKVYLLQYDEHRRNIDLELSGTPHQFASMAKKCLSVEELLQKFGHSENSTLTKSDFTELCPALIQQIISGVCAETKKLPSLMPSKMETYGYGSLSVFVISLTSLAGVLLLPVMTKHAYNYIISGFYGLAFSTLAADAMLHLMPQFLGLHSHGSGDDHEGHSHDHGEFLEPYAQLMLGMFFTVYGLFLFEAVMCAFNKSDHQEGSKGGGHGHSHGHLPDELPTLISVKTKSETQLVSSPVSRDQSSSSLDTEIVEVEAMKKPPNLMVNKPIFLGMTSLAIVVTLGDSIHNFGDGLAIGAAFSTGIRGGLSTAIAVFCHELPHEFGDFVVLLSTGLSFSRALLINFLSGLTCFVGLYIGIVIGDDETARKWVMAVTAGIFLYVALAEMLPELRAHHQGSRIKMLLVKNVGILAGIGIMLLISVYEEKLA